jgi:hypothetical protein
MTEGYVYLIIEGDQHGEEKYKIGITKNDPQERLKKLKTGNSGDLSVLKTYRSKNYKKIEKWLHRKYKAQRTLSNNEFFHLSDSEVIGFVNDCKKIDEIVSTLSELNPFYK